MNPLFGFEGDTWDGFDKTGGSEVLFQSRPSHILLFTGIFPKDQGLKRRHGGILSGFRVAQHGAPEGGE
jgi:hypothetical protein